MWDGSCPTCYRSEERVAIKKQNNLWVTKILSRVIKFNLKPGLDNGTMKNSTIFMNIEEHHKKAN